MTTMVLIKGAGFHVGVNFERATADIPVRHLSFNGNRAEGVMDPQPDNPRAFMRGPGPIFFSTHRSVIAPQES